MANARIFRGAAIGHTGAGNFGHNLHTALAQTEGVRMIAVADPDPKGRRAAQEATGALRAYADYREMLAKEDLDVVAVCPRWATERLEMIRACAEAGCHVYSEKPLARSLDEADAILAAVRDHGVKLAVAHQAVYLPQTEQIKQLIDDGLIGDVQAIAAYGKQDHRGGGEDMLVLGTHLFNLMRFFVGDAAWIWSHVSAQDADVAPGDVREASEPVGLVAGDEVRSYIVFQNGVRARYETRKTLGRKGRPRPYGMEIIGSEGRLAFCGDLQQAAHYPHPVWAPWETSQAWRPLEFSYLPLQAGNRLAILDLLRAADEGQRPRSAGEDAAAALEMIVGAYAAQISGARVRLPLAQREHPLEVFQRKGGVGA